MSRGLQMLVEEGSIPHARMLCGASGAEKSQFFIGNRMKIAFRPWPKSGKWEKLHFGRGRRVKIGKNCVSAMAER